MADTQCVTITENRDAVRPRHSEATSARILPSAGSGRSNSNPLSRRTCEGQPEPRAGSLSPSAPRRFINASQVAKRLSVSERTVRLWAELGELPGFKIGPADKLWRFDPEDIDTYLQNRRDGTRLGPAAPCGKTMPKFSAT